MRKGHKLRFAAFLSRPATRHTPALELACRSFSLRVAGQDEPISRKILTLLAFNYPTFGSMTIAKISVSIDQQLLAFLEGYQQRYQIKAKSEVVSEALRLLRERELESQYAAALQEWKEEAGLWEAVTDDGLKSEPQ